MLWKSISFFLSFSFFVSFSIFGKVQKMCTFECKHTQSNPFAGKRSWHVVNYLWYWGPWVLTSMGSWRLIHAADTNIFNCDHFNTKILPRPIYVSLHKCILIRVQKPLKQHLQHHKTVHSPQWAVSATSAIMSMFCMQQGATLLPRLPATSNLQTCTVLYRLLLSTLTNLIMKSNRAGCSLIWRTWLAE